MRRAPAAVQAWRVLEAGSSESVSIEWVPTDRVEPERIRSFRSKATIDEPLDETPGK